MDLTYLLDMIDLVNEFRELLALCLDEWDANRVFQELAYFRKYGKLSGEYLSGEARAIFNLMLHELKEQIKEADPEWYDAYRIKREERELEARVVDAFLQEKARIDEFRESRTAAEGKPGGGTDA